MKVEKTFYYAVDENEDCGAFYVNPPIRRNTADNIGVWTDDTLPIIATDILDSDMLPDLTWKNNPVKTTITIEFGN